MKESKCRSCGFDLVSVLDLGFIQPSGFFKPGETCDPVDTPLVLSRCTNCSLIQLMYTVEPDDMYKQYWYQSGLNPTMVNALRDIVNSTLSRYHRDGGIVIDIGANDGTMLGMFPGNFYRIGFDPAQNLAGMAETNCELFINDYFSADKLPENTTADIITAIAMFYDLDDPHRFLQDVTSVLADDGIFVIQMMDLSLMLETNAFDNICHEHLCYYSLDDLDNILYEHGMEIFDIEYNDVNGGSIRVYSSFSGVYERTQEVIDAIEDAIELNKTAKINEFMRNVMECCIRTIQRIALAKARNKRVWGLGASTKGNTLLQYIGLVPPIIEKIADINPDKIGLETVKTRIPIVSENDVMYHLPKVLLVLPWHFAKFFIEKFDDYLNRGGELLFPLPQPYSVIKENGSIVYLVWDGGRMAELPWELKQKQSEH